ncbi:LemA family protein [Candidatus Woesebacteria bacterium]|nr:LemA family protein [Candidatus Woesebacteria bacterium]
MKNLLTVLAVPAVIIVVLVFMAVGQYNSFVGLSQSVDNQWAQVETQYQRRLDLIPNLVNSVKGFLTQEQAVFGAIAEARTRYAGAQTVNDKAAAATQVESALGRLLVVMENYPELKSNETVAQLMDELAGTENRISVERRRYNDAVKEYNLKVNQIPGKFFASLFGFSTKNYFESVTGAEVAPNVNLELK